MTGMIFQNNLEFIIVKIFFQIELFKFNLIKKISDDFMVTFLIYTFVYRPILYQLLSYENQYNNN